MSSFPCAAHSVATPSAAGYSASRVGHLETIDGQLLGEPLRVNGERGVVVRVSGALSSADATVQFDGLTTPKLA